MVGASCRGVVLYEETMPRLRAWLDTAEAKDLKRRVKA